MNMQKPITYFFVIFLLAGFANTASAEDMSNDKSQFALDAITERRKAIDESIANYLEIHKGTDSADLVTIEEYEAGAPIIRDPFNATNNAGGINGMQNRFGNSTFLPDADKQKIPSLKLKGVINPNQKANGDLLALLQVNKKDVYMVKVGDEISYDPSNPTAAIKIMSITRLSVQVQVGNLGNILIVR